MIQKIREIMFIKNLFNSLDFWLRRKIRISRGTYFVKNEPKIELFDHLNDKNRQIAESKEKEYCQKYNLYRLKDNSTIRNYLENLYTIQLLEQNLNLSTSNKAISILDIGSKNWFYAEGEYSFFKHAGSDRNIQLKGIEIDAYRLYTNLHSRYDYAKAYIKNLENTNYIADDLMNHQGQYDYITWFLPFITPNPLLNWGLPLKYFQPENMLSKAYSLLKPNGKMLIINQCKEEHILQKKLLESLNINYDSKGEFESIFLSYNYKRFVIVV